MTITLYANRSENARLTKDIAQVASYEGTLRDSTDVLNPVITIETTNNITTGVNYAYIPDFGRYYYITGITVISNNLYQLTMHVDVLMTYRDSILDLTAIIARQENAYNLYLNDPMYKTYQDPIIITKKFPAALSDTTCVLLVAGG